MPPCWCGGASVGAPGRAWTRAPALDDRTKRRILIVDDNASIKLLAHCLKSIGEDGWRSDYEIAYAAHVLIIECEAAGGNTDAAFGLLATLDRCSREGVDRANGRRLEAAVRTQLNRMSEAIAAGVAGAAMLGSELPLEPAALGAAVQAEFGAVMQALGGRAIASLSELPLMTEPRAIALAQVYTTLLPAAFADPARAAGADLVQGDHALASVRES